MAFLFLGMAKVTISQEWTPVFNFNSVNGKIITSNGGKIFTCQAYHFMNESYEAMLSLDNGSTWTQVYDDKFATAFFNSQEDLYAVRQDKFPGTYLYYPQSILITTDNGGSWTIFDTVADNMGQVNASVFRMDNNGTLYTAYRNFSANTGGFKYSTDDGVNWTLIPTFLSGPYSYTDIFSALLSSNGDFYITTYNEGIFKSIDAGENWIRVFESFITLGFLNEHPITGDLYAASFGAILKSTDNGENWVELEPDPWMAMNITEFEITSDGTFYFSNAGGVYKSDDAIHWESIWSPTKGFRSTTLLDMSISNDYVYVSASDSTVYRRLRDTSTGVYSKKDEDFLSVYPIPAKEFINIELNNIDYNTSKPNLTITDISGKLMYNEVLLTGNNSHRVSTADLESGIYIVAITTDANRFTHKLIISK